MGVQTFQFVLKPFYSCIILRGLCGHLRCVPCNLSHRVYIDEQYYFDALYIEADRIWCFLFLHQLDASE